MKIETKMKNIDLGTNMSSWESQRPRGGAGGEERGDGRADAAAAAEDTCAAHARRMLAAYNLHEFVRGSRP